MFFSKNGRAQFIRQSTTHTLLSGFFIFFIETTESGHVVWSLSFYVFE